MFNVNLRFFRLQNELLICRYVVALYQHCRFDVDTERMPSENDEFVEFRVQVSESIKDVAFVIGSLNLVDKVCFPLPSFFLFRTRFKRRAHARGFRSFDCCLKARAHGTRSSRACLLSNQQPATSLRKRQFEALSARPSKTSRAFRSDEDATPRLLELIMRIPVTSNRILVITSIEILGELNEWLSERPNQLGSQAPRRLCARSQAIFSGFCMRWLLSMPMDDIAIMKPLSICLQKLATRGYTHLVAFFDSILVVLQNVERCSGSFSELEDAAEELLKGWTTRTRARPRSRFRGVREQKRERNFVCLFCVSRSPLATRRFTRARARSLACTLHIEVSTLNFSLRVFAQ